MLSLRSRFTPSFAVAVLALAAASGGSAVAAAELVTRADQIAPGIIDGDHIKQRGVARGDLEQPTLRARIQAQGQMLGTGNDATVKRTAPGRYEVTFNTAQLDGGTKVPLPIANCAITATPGRSGGSILPIMLSVLGPPAGEAATVRVFAFRATSDLSGQVSVSPTDVDFHLVAVC